ncbi:class I SAM-dependent methyltransferase [Nocardioides xinjiangensis]|uniref:class I SAM-dependent methyltransferase n=1 Tax=Nocardioides xinjiangensis TaxID=2817376 RepID=UPI001B306D12|nr:class I SAM-dependent methyltransferase [Nocardioides sp. SYSU D00778]
MPDRPALEFEAAWDVASAIPGWLTEDQARLLFDTARDLPAEPLLLEIGSHQGKSTVVLAAAARAHGGRVVAVDPFVDGRLFGGPSTRDKFERNVRAAELGDVVELLPEYSTRARPGWSRDLDYLYIDGKHDYWTLSDDLKWARHLPDGAPVLVHDCYSSIGVTLGVLAKVLPSRHLRYERRAGSLALFRVGRPSAVDRLRIVRELPWWLRNVAVKVLLRLRLRAVAARVFGHEGPYDPY